MKGVILAAGKGTRLYPVTHHIPKPLLPLANRPTLYYAFDTLKEMGVTEICLVVGENAPAMRTALGSGAERGVSLSYAVQTEPKGLAHAVSFAKDFVGDEPFVLYLGDAVYSDDFLELRKTFEQSGAASLNLVQAVDDPQRFGIATVEEGQITKLVEKPGLPESNLAMAGLYFFDKRIWKTLDALQPSARGEFEITDAIQLLIDSGEPVLAGQYAGKWFDTGTLDSFLACSAYLLSGVPLVGLNALFKAEGGRQVCIGDDAAVRCSEIEDSVILPGAHVATTGSIKHCIIGGNVTTRGDLSGEILYGV